MKKNCLKQWSLATISFITMLVMTFPSGAAPARGKITKVDSSSISGWAWNPEDTNDVQQVELHIFRSGNPSRFGIFMRRQTSTGRIWWQI